VAVTRDIVVISSPVFLGVATFPRFEKHLRRSAVAAKLDQFRNSSAGMLVPLLHLRISSTLIFII
jgi:hypothetical protein